jgi:hypothetical protein
MKLGCVGKAIGFGIIFMVLLFGGFDLWMVSRTSVSLVVHLIDNANIGPVRASLCGKPIPLSPVTRTTYRFDAQWIFQCGWAELNVDILSPSGKVRHHQLCYYDDMLRMAAVAKIGPDKLKLKCDYH